LITGRSTKQGTGISTGKLKSEYREATGFIELSRFDMERSGLREGDSVRLSSEFGSTEVRCRQAEVPRGLAFMAFGPACNRLIGDETSASGMPDSKNLKIEIESVEGSAFTVQR